MKTVHLTIFGKVQGVFFRATAKKQAESLDLTGWVSNTRDHVEALITGEAEKIDSFIEWANEGPDRAQVEKVSVSEMPLEKFEEFKIKRERK